MGFAHLSASFTSFVPSSLPCRSPATKIKEIKIMYYLRCWGISKPPIWHAIDMASACLPGPRRLALLGVKYTVAPGQLGHIPVLYIEHPKHLLLYTTISGTCWTRQQRFAQYFRCTVKCYTFYESVSRRNMAIMCNNISHIF